jgi:hypothetical protein
MITNDDIKKVEDNVIGIFKQGVKKAEISWTNAPLNIIDCVLSLNRKYYATVKPRVEIFKKNRPECKSILDLINLFEEYNLDFDNFTLQELNLRHGDRGRIIYEVSKYLQQELKDIEGIDEIEKLKKWAINARPGDASFIGIKGFKISGFQYLRMLFGAQTAKPDVHLINYVSEIIGYKIDDIQTLFILEKIAKDNNLPLRDLDSEIWSKRAHLAK